MMLKNYNRRVLLHIIVLALLYSVIDYVLFQFKAEINSLRISYYSKLIILVLYVYFVHMDKEEAVEDKAPLGVAVLFAATVLSLFVVIFDFFIFKQKVTYNAMIFVIVFGVCGLGYYVKAVEDMPVEQRLGHSPKRMMMRIILMTHFAIVVSFLGYYLRYGNWDSNYIFIGGSFFSEY